MTNIIPGLNEEETNEVVAAGIICAALGLKVVKETDTDEIQGRIINRILSKNADKTPLIEIWFTIPSRYEDGVKDIFGKGQNFEYIGELPDKITPEYVVNLYKEKTLWASNKQAMGMIDDDDIKFYMKTRDETWTLDDANKYLGDLMTKANAMDDFKEV